MFQPVRNAFHCFGASDPHCAPASIETGQIVASHSRIVNIAEGYCRPWRLSTIWPIAFLAGKSVPLMFPESCRRRPSRKRLDEEIDAIIAEFGGDPRAAIRALLHDLTELALDSEAAVSRGYVLGNLLPFKLVRPT